MAHIRWVAAVTWLTGCSVDVQPLADALATDTDADTVADTDTPPDTPPQTTTPIHSPGCFPAFEVGFVDFAGCISETVSFDVIYHDSELLVTETYDAQGRVATSTMINTSVYFPVDEAHFYTVEPASGDVLVDETDYGQDGTIDETKIYTRTFDASGRLLTEESVTTDVNGSVIDGSITTQEWDACGPIRVEVDSDADGAIDETVLTTYFNDGYHEDSTSSAGGVPDMGTDYFVDAVTGQPLYFEREWDPSHDGVEANWTYLAFDDRNQLLQLDGSYWIVDDFYDISYALSYDADGRKTHYEFRLDYEGDAIDWTEAETTWDCP